MFRRRRATFNDNMMQTKRKRLLKRLHFSKLSITIFLLVVLILLTFYTIFFSGVFTLKTVEFNPRQISCAPLEGIKAVLPKKQNILFIKAQEQAEIIRAKFPCLESVVIEKRFPDTLLIHVVERKTVALLRSGIKTVPIVVDLPVEATSEATASSSSAQPKVEPEDPFKIDEFLYSKYFSVDSHGFVLSENPVSDTPLPLFYYLDDQELMVYAHLEEGIMETALHLMQKLYEMQIIVQSAKIEEKNLFIDGPIRITFLLNKEIDAQIIPLQLILQKAKIDSEVIEKIDLRFDKPVVVYKKNQGNRIKN
jgi:cell division septal protein FtsQ